MYPDSGYIFHLDKIHRNITKKLVQWNTMIITEIYLVSKQRNNK